MSPLRRREAGRRYIGTPCRFCGEILTAYNITFDHEPPLSRRPGYPGSTGKQKKLRAAFAAHVARVFGDAAGFFCCKRCNSRRGSMSADEFAAWLAHPHGQAWLARTWRTNAQRKRQRAAARAAARSAEVPDHRWPRDPDGERWSCLPVAESAP